jgi:DNA-binding PadR family transcriptional regulator
MWAGHVSQPGDEARCGGNKFLDLGEALDVWSRALNVSDRAGTPTTSVSGAGSVLVHLILGFLRDGTARHGYELIVEYRERLGEKLNPGNLYRELARLNAQGLVRVGVNPPGADPRRIPCEITERGRQVFDQWLLSPSSQDGDFPGWLAFADRVPDEVRARVLERREEELWVRGKVLARAREDALAKNVAEQRDQYNPLPVLLSRRLKLVAAELEFIQEFRRECEVGQQASAATEQRGSAASRARRAPSRKQRTGRR